MRKPRSFSTEFKRQVVEEYLSGVSTAAQLCRRHSISSGLLYYWKKQYVKNRFEADAAREAALQERINQLEQNPQTLEKIKLGKKLFFDRRLSGDGTMSCATCHEPEKAFADGLDISLNYPTTRNWRNSPTLINVAYQKYLFHDGRSQTLEDQALFSMMSAFEMNRNLDFVEEVIRSVPEYVAEFATVFGDGDTSRDRIAMALASFERSLVSINPPLDRYLKGNKNALSPEAKKGYEIFSGKGRYAECHDGTSLSDHKFHALNVPENLEQEKDPRVAATRRFVAKVYH